MLPRPMWSSGCCFAERYIFNPTWPFCSWSHHPAQNWDKSASNSSHNFRDNNNGYPCYFTMNRGNFYRWIDLQQWIKVNPEHPARIWLSKIYLQKRILTNFLLLFKAVTLKPDYITAIVQQAIIYGERGNMTRPWNIQPGLTRTQFNRHAL